MRSYDAVVIGAGPAGGSAAFFLARAGLRVAVVERREFPRRKVCGEFVSAATFPILDEIGIGHALRSAGGPPVGRVGIIGSRAAITAPMPPAANPSSLSASGLGRTLRRDVLDTELLGAAEGAGAEVFQPWRGVGLRSSAGRHTLTIQSGDATEDLSAPILVVAHGSWEPGPLPTQPEHRHRPDDLLAFKAYFRGATFDPDLISLIAIPGGYGGMVHRDPEHVGLSLCLRRDHLERCRAQAPDASTGESVFRYAAAHARGVAEAIDGAEFESAPMAAGPIRPGLHPPYERGIFRVGNAAGEAHPAIAEGISIAIQSGLLLGNVLATSTESLDVAGARYAAAWRAQFRGRLRASEAFARACMSPTADRLLAPVLTAFPGLLTTAAVLSGKTKPLRTEWDSPV